MEHELRALLWPQAAIAADRRDRKGRTMPGIRLAARRRPGAPLAPAAALLLALAAVLLLVLAPALAARAETPMRVVTTVTDTTGRVDRIAEIERAAERLELETGTRLYYVVVDRFDDPSSSADWAHAVAERSDLGPLDALLVVSLGQAEYAFDLAQDHPVSDPALRDIEAAVAAELDRGEFGQAGVVAADLMRAALAGTGGGDAGTSGGDAGSDAVGTGLPTGLFLGGGAVVAALVAAGIAIASRRRTAKSREQQEEQREEALAARLQAASQELVRTDNLIRSAQEELGFAEAGFGTEAAAPFRAALDEAKCLAHEAFGLQAKLLDHEPDSPQEREEWTAGIEDRTGRAQQVLQAELDRFAELRTRQEHAPALLRAVQERLAAAPERLESARARIDRLRPGLDPVAIAPLDADGEQARQLAELALDETRNAAAGLEAGRHGPAVVDIGDAESALAQLDQLVERLDNAATRIEQAPATIAAESAQLRRDLGRLQQLHREASGRFALDPQLPAVIAETTGLLDGVDADQGRHRTPLETLERLRIAAASIGTALTSALGSKEQFEHAAQRLPQAIGAARADVDAATSFISTRRGAISSVPRTRLDQASAQLSRAESLATSDPKAALTAAGEASELARTALSAAQRELDSAYAAQQSPFGGGDRYGDYRSGYGSSGSGLGDAILGGIIGGILSGGGASRRNDRDWGGFGGGWGGSGGFGGGFSGGFSSGTSRSSRGGFSSGTRSRSGGFRSSSGGGFRSGGGGRRR